MSGLTPSRIRSKTSEFTEFFRARDSANQAKFPSNDLSTQSQATTYTFDVPSTSGTSSDGVVKKKSTRIPFLGRQRKKSNPNQSATERESTDVGESWKEGRPTFEITEPLPQVRQSQIAAPSPSKPQSTSLGSKLAATFSPRARKLSAVGSKPPVPVPPKAGTLSPPNPTNPRGVSLDSSRSVTPQPAQPTITISPTPEDLSEFKDLFTVHSKFKVKPTETSETNTYSIRNASPAESPQIATTPESTQRIPRRGSEPAVRESSRQKATKSPRPGSSTGKYTKPSRRSSDKENSSSSSTPRNSDGKDSARSSVEKVTGPPVQRRPSGLPTTPAAEYSAQQRLRLRQLSPTAEKKNRPPSIPLPQAPSSPSPPPSSADVTNSAAGSTPRGQRSRAGTVSSVTSIPQSPLSQSTVPNDSEGETTPQAELASFDIDSATMEQLREVLRSRDRQCDELASTLAKTMKDHSVEKTALEHKVSQLEKEMSKKDNQIKGLMWLVAHNKNPPATDFPGKYDLPNLPSTDDTGSISSKFSGRLPTRRSQLSDDSGAEYPTSGAESLRSGSDLSGNESPARHRRLRRPYTTGEGGQSLYRAVTSKRTPPPNAALPDLPVQAGKRSSISSVSLSPASSTSSLLPPSPSVTVSSLSSIPEAPSSLRYSSKLGTNDTTAYHEDRQFRTANRMSTSSMASSSTAASSAYATNLKRSRPPSIAQVLDHLPQRG